MYIYINIKNIYSNYLFEDVCLALGAWNNLEFMETDIGDIAKIVCELPLQG